ncbi:unnamed protein product [Ambrosiozyma monospora]|uniref:Unnamed protein product n=1 Tax=Ambrosiozyma monospora TaxID=43982 RepID=A0ACB5TRB9_AMBMO|nr:unnamed protein product [Ambrosiozyma monospora]
METGKDSQTTVSPEQRDRILRRAKLYVPQLFDDNGEVTIVREQVGFRPAREGGIRLELDDEFGKVNAGTGVALIHNYGHGGYGYQASYGCAQKVIGIVDDYLSGKKSTLKRQSKF